MEDKRPRFLQSNTNGQYREDHAHKSMLFRICEKCSDESGEETTREFQLESVLPSEEVSVFRCVICHSNISVNHKELKS